jgi:hypothetical protein
MSSFWDERYSTAEYAYGREPNEYLKAKLQGVEPGKILFAAEGEGRNAVYAVRCGWITSAFDLSSEGKRKTEELAKEYCVAVDYKLGELPSLGYSAGQFDAVALIYAHFPAALKENYCKLLDSYLRKGGTMIFEAFSKDHLRYNRENPKVGGPKEENMLFSTEEISSYFKDHTVLELEQKEITLQEGLYHNGPGSVIRFCGIKN